MSISTKLGKKNKMKSREKKVKGYKHLRRVFDLRRRTKDDQSGKGKCEKEPMGIQGESMKTVCRAERTE